MTAVKENGQLYFTFEELDFEGAILDVVRELDAFASLVHQARQSNAQRTISFAEKGYKKLLRVWAYLQNMNDGKPYKEGLF